MKIKPEKSPMLQMVELAKAGKPLPPEFKSIFDRIAKQAEEAVLSMILWDHRN